MEMAQMEHRRGRVVALLATVALFLSGVFVMTPEAQAASYTSNMPTLNITLPAGVTQGDLDSSKSTVRAGTQFSVEDPTGVNNLSTLSGEIKGRGNYTWKLAKKPYQIKFAKAQPLLGMPAAKTWVLLANHADASLMRNKVAYDLAAAVGLDYSSESRWVDLVINGEYRGNYLVTEKVQVGKNRVELTHPQAILTELDRGETEEYFHYTSTSKSIFTLKDAKSDIPDKVDGPLPADTLAGWNDMKSTLNRLDAALYAKDPNWATISSIIDVDSFVKYYFVFELGENPEITQSSVYFYKNGPNDKLHAGPVWDFDSALGNYDKSESLGADTQSDYIKNAKILRGGGNGWQMELFRNSQFVERANAMWKGGIAYNVSQLPSKIDGYKAQVAKSAANNFNKWKILGTPTLLVAGQGKAYASTYSAEVDQLKSWVSKRSTMLRKLYGDVPIVRAKGHSSSIGWLPYVNSGQIIGTTGKAKSLEALNLELVNKTGVTGSVQANAHVRSIGWMGNKTLSPTTLVGTTGRALAIEAIQFRLTGALATKYDISYRAHVETLGWLPWVTNGATAGTTGQAKRAEAVQVRLVMKTAPTPKPGPTPTPTPTVTETATATPTTTATPTVTETTSTTPPVETSTTSTTTTPTTPPTTPTVTPTVTPTPADKATASYSAHVSRIGWMATVTNGAVAGTTGKALAMEALKLKVTSAQYSGDIQYRAHVRNIGWMPWTTSANYIGTVGKALPIEAIEIKLTGTQAAHYSISYRAHVQSIGWQSYRTDGQMAGTTGQARRVEAVQISLVPKP